MYACRRNHVGRVQNIVSSLNRCCPDKVRSAMKYRNAVIRAVLFAVL
jgi:hypothetical protein